MHVCGRIDYTLPDGVGNIATEFGHFILIAYRLRGDGKIDMSLHGRPFMPAEASEWVGNSNSPIFTPGTPLVIGGVREACGYVGDIAEVSIQHTCE
jgi:hypothetical protein